MNSPTETFHSRVYPAIDPSRPELSTKGKTIFITGGGAGVGAALARSFAIAVATNIAIIGRRTALLEATKIALQNEFQGLSVFTRVADVLDRIAVDGAFSDFSANIGPIDVLVHNVGYLSHVANIKDTEIEEWWRGFEINIKGSFIIAQGFLPHAARNAKVIYLTTAVAIREPFPGISGYVSSKLGATKVFEYLQAENPDLRVISMHLGVLQTEMQEKLIKDGISMPQHEIDPEAEFMKGKFM
ncbi:NAD(P)-binding protein [Hyaloscypha variabilis F]|uniref:NAD(P)-binding protein n=1 Tax=Hyaloscypha variabilis (strain UAMH 11265 / GT02V1 / F) TaxID=1149755 RepID=A0A2J6R7Q4_HYAVF|nr:NAD(P)-binding protein [Hyaloscypha variabilis F]